MTTVLAEVSADVGVVARGHFARNVARLPLELTLPDLAWTLGRDGSLTARTGDAWLSGCSVPRRAAEQMLRALSTRGPVVCMLLPTHAQQIAATLDRLDPTWALIAIVQDTDTLAPMLACCDFSDAIGAGRLFFATCDADLRAIFEANPGLPIPQQFVRTVVTDGPASEIAIKWAQSVFGEVAQRQQQMLAAARSSWKPSNEGLCVIAAQRFRLWADAGHMLAATLNQPAIDLDDPRSCAPAYLAQRAAEAGAIVTADRGRADHLELAHPDQPWIAWITRARVPAFVPTSPRDGLLLANDSYLPQADAAGWPRKRVKIARWPAKSQASTSATTLTLLLDLPDLSPPKEIEEFSSWRVIWDAVRKDLFENPHHLGDSLTAYLQKARAHFDVPEAQFPAQTFIDRLIAPAYAIGIARWLLREGLPVRVWGRGWDVEPELVRHWSGPVENRAALADALTNAALVDPFLDRAHPLHGAGRVVVSTFGRTALRVLQEARAALAGRGSIEESRDVLSIDIVRLLLDD